MIIATATTDTSGSLIFLYEINVPLLILEDSITPHRILAQYGPCHISCKNCTEPNNQQSCTSCADGLIPYNSSYTSFNCTPFGSDAYSIECIHNFFAASKPSGTVQVIKVWDGSSFVGFNVRLLDKYACPGSNLTIYLNGFANIDQYTSRSSDSSSVSVSLPFALIQDTCRNDAVLNSGSQKYYCTVYIYLIGATTMIKGGVYKINLQIIKANDNTATISNTSIGYYGSYDNNVIAVNESTVVYSLVCTNETCTDFSVRNSYAQGEIISIVHYSKKKEANIIAVNGLEVLFTGAKKIKDAMNYIISQEYLKDGSLLVRIKLLDGSAKAVKFTFDLMIDDGEMTPRNYYTRNSLTLPSISLIEEGCHDFTFDCLAAGFIGTIIFGTLAGLLIIAIVLYCICKKKCKKKEEGEDIEIQSKDQTARTSTSPSSRSRRNSEMPKKQGPLGSRSRRFSEKGNTTVRNLV